MTATITALFICSGKALLTYFGKWDFVEANSKFKLSQQLYTAPGMPYHPPPPLVPCVYMLLQSWEV